MKNLFTGCKTPQEVKNLYRKLCLKYHPDMPTGDTESMQKLNDAYHAVLANLSGFEHEGHTYIYQEDIESALAEMIAKVISLEGVVVEIIGTWIWLSGETYEHKKYIKECGFKWSQNKQTWHWHKGEYYRKHRTQYGMDDIRAMWGSQRVRKEDKEKEKVLNG